MWGSLSRATSKANWKLPFQTSGRASSKSRKEQRIIHKWQCTFASPTTASTSITGQSTSPWRHHKLMLKSSNRKEILGRWETSRQCLLSWWCLNTSTSWSVLQESVGWATTCWCRPTMDWFISRKTSGLLLTCSRLLRYCCSTTITTLTSTPKGLNMIALNSNDDL